MPLKTNYRNISWNGLRKYQLIQNQDGTVSFLDVTEYTNVQDAKVLAADLNTNNDLVNRIMAGEFFYTEAESDALLALKQNVLSFDNAPTANSDNPVKSGGIKAALDLINTRINNLKVFAIHVCQSGEYDPDTLMPTVENPDTKTFYLVPSGTGSDLFTEWIYINNRWEIFGSSQIDMSNYVTVTDLQDALDDKQDVLTFDNVPTANSNNPVKSGGVKTALDGKADGDHNHDERYYTESEMNAKLAGKAAADHTHEGVYYTETEVDDLLSEKRDVSDSYSRTEVETLLSAKSDNTHNHDNSYAAKSHNHDERYYTGTEINTLLAAKQDTLTFDSAPTAESMNPVTSGGVKTALDGKAASDHNHDGAYAAKSHNHDDLYYTESEINSKLAAKQDTLTFDTAPTANSTNPVTSGGVKTALDGKAASNHNHDGVYAAADHNHDSAYAAKSHNHDERYYTETEVNTLLSGKSDTGHTHDESQVEHHTYYVKGTQTASTNAWTGKLPEVDALYDGLAIDYFLPFAGTSSAATLNLTLKDGTKTGAIPVYRDGANTFTNNVGANQIIRLIYHSVTISGTVRTGWRIIRTQDNNDAANRIYNGSAAYQANSAVYRYQLLFQVDENKLTPLNNVNNSTATNKTMLTGVDFLPFGKIFYYNSTTNVTANGNMTTSLNDRANFDLRYSLNSGTTLTAHRDIYLKCVKQSNGKFRITADPCWTQSLPSTADGYYYLRLGRTYSTSNMYLDEDHPIYYHDGTALRFYTDPAKAVPFAALTGNPTDNSALSTALDGKAAADHNHDSAYAAKSHNHDERYYTGTEINTLLAAKQDTLTFDTTPTASSTNPVTSGGLKSALDGKQNTLYKNTGVPRTVADDTVANWQLLGHCTCFYGDSAQLIDKPSAYGWLVNIALSGYDITQLWFTQPSGKIYRRSGNGNGWDGSWVEVFSEKSVIPVKNGGTGQSSVDTTPTANSSKMVTSDGIKSALDAKLNKSGGTMTGGLTISRATSNSAVITKLNSSSVSSLPSSNEVIFSSVTIDKDANWMGQVYNTLYPTGRVVFTIGASNKFTGSYKYNLLDFVIDQNGNLGINVSSSAAWRNGLGASNGVWPTSVGGTGGTDSGWQSYTNSSKFTGTIYYRKVGAFLMISTASAKLNTELAANSYRIIGQLPAGYRPSVEISAICMFNTFSSNTLAEVQIGGDGTIYLFTNTNPIPANNALRFSGFGFI